LTTRHHHHIHAGVEHHLCKCRRNGEVTRVNRHGCVQSDHRSTVIEMDACLLADLLQHDPEPHVIEVERHAPPQLDHRTRIHGHYRAAPGRCIEELRTPSECLARGHLLLRVCTTWSAEGAAHGSNCNEENREQSPAHAVPPEC